ncbi:rhodanese-like domain-containing protein [Rutstroemia sp. NJR-2017a BBW]|nr:rhodanese-like domain-containing protein [Rutstroemia sp. NJR-2017a BBW]
MSTVTALSRAIARGSRRTAELAVRPQCRRQYQPYCPFTTAAVATRTAPAPHRQIRAYSQTVKELKEENAREKAAHEKGEHLGPTKKYTFEQIQDIASSPDPHTHIIDVRTPQEIEQTGRIPTALHICITTAADAWFISEEEFEERYGFERPKKDDEVIFYCKSGVRSRGAAEVVRNAGWRKVGEFQGSWLEWEKKGGEVEK